MGVQNDEVDLGGLHIKRRQFFLNILPPPPSLCKICVLLFRNYVLLGDHPFYGDVTNARPLSRAKIPAED